MATILIDGGEVESRDRVGGSVISITVPSPDGKKVIAFDIPENRRPAHHWLKEALPSREMGKDFWNV